MFGLFKSEKQRTKDRLKSYKFPQKFRVKLWKEHDWAMIDEELYIAEYLKFCYLAKYHGKVTPLKLVDAIWHCHLKFENEYQDFCKNYLKYDLVHTPGNGSEEDDLKHRKQYEETRNLYASEFGVIDSAVWGHSNTTNSQAEHSFGGGDFGGSGAGSDWSSGNDSSSTTSNDSSHSSCSSSSCSSSCGSSCGGGD